MYDFLRSSVDGWVTISKPAAENFLKLSTGLTTQQQNDYVVYLSGNTPVLRYIVRSGERLYEVFQVKGDLDLTGNKINLIRDVGHLKQTVEQGLLTDRGEWFANINYGIPYVDQIISVKNSESILNNQILAFLDTFPEITDVLDFNIDIDKRKRVARVSFEVQTSYNETFELTVELL